jgi:hypothetical protein
MASYGSLRRVALVRTDVLEELSVQDSILRGHTVLQLPPTMVT